MDVADEEVDCEEVASGVEGPGVEMELEVWLALELELVVVVVMVEVEEWALVGWMGRGRGGVGFEPEGCDLSW